MNAEQQKERYLEIVKAQIPNKSVRKEIEKELLNHIEEQLEAVAGSGEDEEQAMRRILKEMGEPKRLGISFRQVHTQKFLGQAALLAALTIGLYTGSMAGYLDLISIFLVTVIACFIYRLFFYKQCRWEDKSASWSRSFLYSGFVIAVLSLIAVFTVQIWKKEFINLILLPFWHGLLFCVLIHTGKAIGEWISNKITEDINGDKKARKQNHIKCSNDC